MKSITPIDCIEHFWVEILERKISISEKDSSLIMKSKSMYLDTRSITSQSLVFCKTAQNKPKIEKGR